MPVTFNGSGIVPAPFITITEDIKRFSNGQINRPGYTIVLSSTIVNIDTSLDSTGASSYSGLDGILAGQKYLRQLFTVDKGNLVITKPDGNTYSPVTIGCRPESIVFGEGNWVNLNRYTVTLKAEIISDDVGTFGLGLEDISENWSVNENDNSTYSVTHRVQAKGLLVNNAGTYNDPTADAKTFVYSRLASCTDAGVFSYNFPPSGTLNFANLIYALPSTTGYFNRQTVEDVDPISYTYGITESFTFCPSGNFIEDFTVGINYNSDNITKLQVTVNGSVLGLAGDVKNYVQRFNAANTRFNNTVEPSLYIKATAYSPVNYTIFPYPTSKSVTKEPNSGRVSYSVTYPATSGATLIPGAIEESVEISDTGLTNIFASIPIPSRSAGPIIQNMATFTSPQRSINISAKIAASGTITTSGSLLSAYLAKPNTDNLITALSPNNGLYFLLANAETWNPLQRVYSRSVSWVLKSQNVVGTPSGIYSI